MMCARWARRRAREMSARGAAFASAIVAMIVFAVAAAASLAIAAAAFSRRHRAHLARVSEEYYAGASGKRYRPHRLVKEMPSSHSRFIEEQTKIWTRQRASGPCYAMLEKDKVVMEAWKSASGIPRMATLFCGYMDRFSPRALREACGSRPTERTVLKMTHLQSSNGVRVLRPFAEWTSEYEADVLAYVEHKADSCFVCALDGRWGDSDPSAASVANREDEARYALYETVEPGVLIEEYFDGGGNGAPEEVRVVVYAGQVVDVRRMALPPLLGMWSWLGVNLERLRPALIMAMDVAVHIGAGLVAVDFFIPRGGQGPCAPVLNEISLSPYGGVRRTFGAARLRLRALRADVAAASPGHFGGIDALLAGAPRRRRGIRRHSRTENGFSRGAAAERTFLAA